MPQSTPTNFYVGESVVVRGTGRYWAGLNYEATVVDVRDTDETIKVRYTDGGYKRFTKAELESLVMQSDNSAYKLQVYEMDEDKYDPTVEAVEEVGSLRRELNTAIANKNFKEAHRIKMEMAARMQKAEQLREERHKLKIAIQNEDFLTADKLQKKIDSLSAAAVATGVDVNDVFRKALARAAGGGMAGATAMFIQVGSLMWMRTTMNYQYKYGTTTLQAIKKLYAEGGVRRFYRGIAPALFQGPLSRFGDTAANTGILAFLNAYPATANLPVALKTVAASATAAGWRIFLMPIDTLKTTLQVDGKPGITNLMAKSRASGPFVFYHGALAASAATFAGHYPWFFTYNMLDSYIPIPDTTLGKLGRNAFMGFASSVVSDTTSNSIRVVKTFRQTSAEAISYPETVRHIIKEDGLIGLFGRGLQTRILANGVQGLMFSVLWKYFDEKIKNS